MQSRYLIIWLTLFVSLIVQVMPWPININYLQPNWIFLTLFYWALMLPHRANIGVAFLMGFIFDLILGSALGIHSLVFCTIIYLLSFRFQFIRNLRLWQQMGFVVIFSTCYSLFVYCVEFLLNNAIYFQPRIFLSALTDGILWPWYFLFLHFLQTKFRLY